MAKDSKQQSLPTARVCEMVSTGLTTAVHTLRPATKTVPPMSAPADAATLPQGAQGQPIPEPAIAAGRDITDWLRPLAILLAAIAISMILFEWKNFFDKRVPVAPLPQNIHLGPENRALLENP
jgi:hypothetical protein